MSTITWCSSKTLTMTGTVNWYYAYHVVHEDIVVDIWPIIPRGPVHHGISDLG
jgi:hypothetical protein